MAGESSSGLHCFSRPTNCVATFMPHNNKKMLTTFSPDFVNHPPYGAVECGDLDTFTLFLSHGAEHLKKMKSHL
jgi:hypothetical protein